MKRYLFSIFVLFTYAGTAQCGGLLIPVEPDIAPLVMLNHHVTVTIEDQVAVTTVKQTFRNHTDKNLEANYVFPVPAGASVQRFVLFVNGEEMKAELLTADEAKQVYASIVRQTKIPAILDYIGSDLLRLKIYPIPAKGDQTVEISFTTVSKKDQDLVEYIYPLKTDRAAVATLEEFRLTLNLKSQQSLGSIYSPTHQISVSRKNDHEAVVRFERYGAQLDRDFKLFYAHSGRDIGLTALQQRSVASDDGYVMLLVSPRTELDQKIPRDIVFVLDTSGSMMQEKKMEQAKRALHYCLGELSPQDRFGIVQFATTVNQYRDQLIPVSSKQIKHAQLWVEDQMAAGGTAIHRALLSAMDMQTNDAKRMFTIVFLTDGQPTIGETDTGKILADVKTKNTDYTRIFTLGVGDNLNAVFMDRIADQTRALSRYIRPNENVETNVASFFNKINNPVLANLALHIGNDVRLVDLYPPQLPDLFHGDQLVVLARYQGAGHAAITLKGEVGEEPKQFVYEVDFEQQTDHKPFVEELWARRKVGYLLDQIRINGEQKELVDEVVRLAKNYAITTPYTSYLIMPDAPVELASSNARRDRYGYAVPAALQPQKAGEQKLRLEDFAKSVQRQQGELASNRGLFQDDAFRKLSDLNKSKPAADRATEYARQRVLAAQQLKGTLDLARGNYQSGKLLANQVSKQGVDLAVCTKILKCQSQLQAKAVLRVASRNCMEIGGVWIDEEFTASTSTVSVKAQSDAYFHILERQPQMKHVFRLGNHIVWITPHGIGLVIDTTDGIETITDKEIDLLFAGR